MQRFVMKFTTVLVILLVEGIGAFVVGDLVEASMYGYGDVITYELVSNFKDFQDFPHLILKTAYLMSNQVISKVAIDIPIDTITIVPLDTNENPYLVNVIKECVFASEESIDGTAFEPDPNNQNLDPSSIDDGVCIVCRFTDEAGQVVAEGEKDLPNGYEGNNVPISINMFDPENPEVNNVRDIHDLQFEVQSLVLDFSNLDAGDQVTNQYISNGIEIFGYSKDSVNQNPPPTFNVHPLNLMIYDSTPHGGQDVDLEVNIGNILMIPHDDIVTGTPDPLGVAPAFNPNDSPNGGWQVFIFSPERFVNSLVFVDADRNNVLGMDVVTAYSAVNAAGNDCDDITDDVDNNTGLAPGDGIPDFLIAGPIQILNTGDQSKQTIVTMASAKTKCLKVQYMDSGAVAAINLGCPLPDDFENQYNPPPPPSGGYTEPQVIFFTSFEGYDEKNNWTFDSSRSDVQVDGPQDFNIFSENSNDPAFANSGLRYLGGRGDFDPGFAAYNREIDVSGFHDVEVSVWYSAEDTENADDFALYYKDGSSWQPIKVVPKTEHDLVGGQLSWTNVVKQIPDGINPHHLR